MDTLQGRRRRIPRGVWYLVIPVLTFGWLSAVPFIHAGLRLRDRGVLLLAGVYAVGGAVAFTLLAVAPVDAQGDTDWHADAGLGLGVVLAGSACVLLVPLRRRVFSALSEQNGALDSAPHDDRAEVTSPEAAPPVAGADLPQAPPEAAPPVAGADLPQAPPEGSRQEAQSAGTQPAQRQETADAPGRTPWERAEATSPEGGGLPKAASPSYGAVFGAELGCAAMAFLIAWVLLIGVATCVSEGTCTHLLGIAWALLMAAHPVLVVVCGAMFIVGSRKKRDALKHRAVRVLPIGITVAWVVFLVLLDPTPVVGLLKEIFRRFTGIPVN